MRAHDKCRSENAIAKLNGKVDSAFSSTRSSRDCHAFCVEYVCHVSKNACQCTTHCHIHAQVEFDLDVTENLAIPPQFRVCRGPYQYVDEVLEVRYSNAEDEDSRCEVLGFDVQDQRD